MLDLLQSQKQLIGVSVQPDTELSAMIGEHGVDPGLILLEEGQDSWLSPWPPLPLTANS